MKKICLALLLAGIFFEMTSCYKSDIDDLRSDLQKQDKRIADLETWQKAIAETTLTEQNLKGIRILGTIDTVDFAYIRKDFCRAKTTTTFLPGITTAPWIRICRIMPNTARTRAARWEGSSYPMDFTTCTGTHTNGAWT